MDKYINFHHFFTDKGFKGAVVNGRAPLKIEFNLKLSRHFLVQFIKHIEPYLDMKIRSKDVINQFTVIIFLMADVETFRFCLHGFN